MAQNMCRKKVAFKKKEKNASVNISTSIHKSKL